MDIGLARGVAEMVAARWWVRINPSPDNRMGANQSPDNLRNPIKVPLTRANMLGDLQRDLDAGVQMF